MITKGSNYTCDRCGKVEFLTDTEARNTKWQTVTHITSDAVNVSRLLCEKCATDYKAVADTADKAFNEFMNGVSK